MRDMYSYVRYGVSVMVETDGQRHYMNLSPERVFEDNYLFALVMNLSMKIEDIYFDVNMGNLTKEITALKGVISNQSQVNNKLLTGIVIEVMDWMNTNSNILNEEDFDTHYTTEVLMEARAKGSDIAHTLLVYKALRVECHDALARVSLGLR